MKITLYGWRADEKDFDEDSNGLPIRDNYLEPIYAEEFENYHIVIPRSKMYKGQVNLSTRTFSSTIWFKKFEDAKQAQIEFAEEKIEHLKIKLKYYQEEIKKIKKSKAPI